MMGISQATFHRLVSGARVTVIDNYDYEFSTMNSMGIKTIIQNVCNYSEGTVDMVFMAHVYHDLVLNCKEKTLENLREISISPNYSFGGITLV